MIPSVDSNGYAPLLEFQSIDPTPGALGSQAAPSSATTAGNLQEMAVNLRPPRRGAKPQPGFPFHKVQKLLESITKVIEAISILVHHKNSVSAASSPTPSNSAASSATATTPTRQTQPSWLTSIDEEPTLVIPSFANETEQTTATPTVGASSTTTDNSAAAATPPGTATLPLDSQEEIPDLAQTGPAATAKQYEIGSKLRGSGQFLWKPVSDKDGNLAILIPSKLTGKIKSVVVLSPDKSKVLGRGSYSGVGNGNREHFRFSKSGGEYPDKSIALVTLKDGSKQYVTIRDSSSRYTQ